MAKNKNKSQGNQGKQLVLRRKLHQYRERRQRVDMQEQHVWFLDEPIQSLEDEYWNHLPYYGYDDDYGYDYTAAPLSPLEHWLNALSEEYKPTQGAGQVFRKHATFDTQQPDHLRFLDWIRVLDEEPSVILENLEHDSDALAQILELKRILWPTRSLVFTESGPPIDSSNYPSKLSEIRLSNADSLDGKRANAQALTPQLDSEAGRSTVLALVALGYPFWTRSASSKELPVAPFSAKQVLTHFFGLFEIPHCYYHWLDSQVCSPHYYYAERPHDDANQSDPLRVWPCALGIPFLGWYVAKAQGLSLRNILKDTGTTTPKGLLHAMEKVSAKRLFGSYGQYYRPHSNDWASLNHLVQATLEWLSVASDLQRTQGFYNVIVSCIEFPTSNIKIIVDLVRWLERVGEDVFAELADIRFAYWYRHVFRQAEGDGQVFVDGSIR